MGGVLAGLALLGAAAIVPSSNGNGPSANAVWAVRFEDFVNPARRAAVRAAAEARGCRWGAVDAANKVHACAMNRAGLISELERNGFRRSVAPREAWVR